MGEGVSSDPWVVKLDNQQKAYDHSSYLSKERAKSIYKIPHDFIEISGNDSKIYTPQIVSFGPYHHGKPHLQPMEHHKERALYRILARKNLPVDLFVESLKKVEQQLVDSYDDLNLENDLPSDAFLEMMLLDGCFMLEILRFKAGDFDGADPIFSNHGTSHMFNLVYRDMLFLENQIPLLVLKALLEAESGKVNSEAEGYEMNKFINELVIEFFGFQSSSPSPILSLHPLDVYRRCILQDISSTGGSDQSTFRWPCLTKFRVAANSFRNLSRKIFALCAPKPNQKPQYMRSAKRLHDAGVNFKRSDAGKKGSSIEFDDEEGVLTLPFIHIDDLSASIYMNMMSFERMYPEAGNEVSSFVSFMDNLIDTAEDVSILSSEGIILHILGSDEAAASLFNKLGEGIIVRTDDQRHVVKERLMKYTATGWHTWRANLVHTYFNHPWSCLSLFAGILLLLLTIIQTVFAVLSYRQSP